MGVIDELNRAREAYDRRDWVAAYEALSENADHALTAADFARLSMAAYLLGRRNDCVQALQRAYQANLDAGELAGAVRSAFWLAFVLLNTGEPAVGGGWVARAQRLLDQLGDVVERGYVLIHVMFASIHSGEIAEALRVATEVEEYGHRFGNPDLTAMGLGSRGRLLLYTGQVREGLTMLDEAMVCVAAGEVAPALAGSLYCSMVEACQEVSDFDRAAEWTRVLTRWCETQPGLVPFTGQCAVHRGQIMRLRGALPEALEEFDRAVERYLVAGSDPAAGLAYAERAEVLRIRGEYDAAQDAYDRAVELGHDPHPGLALLWLDRGRTESAIAALRRLLAEPRDPVHRSQLLPAAVSVLLSDEAYDEAASVAAELEELAERFDSRSMRAAGAFASGAVAAGRDDPASAAPLLRRAAELWQQLEAPYEVARARALLGRALLALDDEASGDAELASARRSFQDLGAIPAAHAVAALLGSALPSGLTAREVEVLRLVAQGQSNLEVAARLVLSEKTVARHLSNIFTKLDVHTRTAAAAFAHTNRLV